MNRIYELEIEFTDGECREYTNVIDFRYHDAIANIKTNNPHACITIPTHNIKAVRTIESTAPTGHELITQERLRQILDEGWTVEHDDEYEDSELICAACYYAWRAALSDIRRNSRSGECPESWPWDISWWKPGSDNSNASRIRELTKAGALIAAEIDRLSRIENYNE